MRRACLLLLCLSMLLDLATGLLCGARILGVALRSRVSHRPLAVGSIDDGYFEDWMEESVEKDRANENGNGTTVPSVKQQIEELKRVNSEAEDNMAGVGDGLRKFRHHTQQGIKRLQVRDLEGALSEFDLARSSNTSQPLVQRGITLYLLGRFEEAAAQLTKDVERMESSKTYKASDIRLWLSACWNHLGSTKKAKTALELNAYSAEGTLLESRHLMTNLLLFFGQEKTLEEMLDVIGTTERDANDVQGTIFYGNFFLGLYFESIGEMDMAKAFLDIPCGSDRYDKQDLWHHVPFMLARRMA
jgi:hypothetical protein